MNQQKMSGMIVVRVIWGALILGQIVVLGIAMFLSKSEGRAAMDAGEARTLFIASIAMLVSAVPVGFFVRRMIHSKAERPDGKIPLRAYMAGNIVLWALCEGAAMFGIVL